MERNDINTEFWWGNLPLAKPRGRLADRREENFENRRTWPSIVYNLKAFVLTVLHSVNLLTDSNVVQIGILQ